MRYAVDVARALEQAHRRGIAHRDLKPGNIMLATTGVKLLDFGLARLRAPAHVVGVDSPTLPMTREGVTVGTPEYMAPEQVQGKETDTRTDIFAFGSVLYEMISGRRAFPGNSQPEVMAAILRSEPGPPLDFVPAALNRVLKVCWAIDPDERWQSAGDLRRELAWIGNTESPSAPPERGIQRREVLAWSMAALGGLAGAAALLNNRIPRAPDQRRARFAVAPPGSGRLNLFQSFPSIPPDGKLLAFVAIVGARMSIWVRAIDSLEVREIADTDAAGGLFWSPDSRFLAFFSQNKLKHVSISGGSIQTICDAPFGPGGSWNEAGTILFSPLGTGGAVQMAPSFPLPQDRPMPRSSRGCRVPSHPV